MICNKCGIEISNNLNICENCSIKERKPFFSIILLKKSAIIVSISLIIQLILVSFLSIRLNYSFMNLLKDNMSLYNGSKINILNPLLLLKLANFNSIKIIGKESIINNEIYKLGVGKANFLVLFLIPAASFLIAWLIYNKFINKEKPADHSIRFFLYISIIYSLLFGFFSLFTHQIFSSFEISIYIKTTVFSSILNSFIISAVSNILILMLMKQFGFNNLLNNERKLIIKTIYFFFIIGFVFSSITAISQFFAIVIKSFNIKGILIFILLLPNVIMFLFDLHLGSGFSYKMSDIDVNLKSFLFGNVGSTILAVFFIIFLIIIMTYQLKKLYYINKERFIQNTLIIGLGIVLIKYILFHLFSFKFIFTDEIGIYDSFNITLGTNIFLAILISLFVIFISALLIKLLENNPVFNKLYSIFELKNKKIIILSLLFILALSFGFSLLSKKDNSFPLMNDNSDTYTKASLGHDLGIYNDYYILKHRGITYYWDNGKIKTFHKNLNDKKILMTTNNKVIYEDLGKLIIANHKGKQIYKQKITADKLAATNKDMTIIVFWLNGSLHLYDSSKNLFLEITVFDMNLNMTTSVVNINEAENSVQITSGNDIGMYDFKENIFKIIEVPTYYCLENEDSLISIITRVDETEETVLKNIKSILYFDSFTGNTICTLNNGNYDIFEYKNGNLINISSNIRYSIYKYLDKGIN